MFKTIEAYLDGTLSYMEGCSVFLSITNNKNFALRLMREENEVNEQTLRYELTKYLQSQPNYWDSVVAGVPYWKFIAPSSEPHQPEQPKSFLNITQPYTPGTFVEDQEHDQSVHHSILKERNALMRERGHFHGQLHNAKTVEERYEIACKLMSLQRSIDSLNLDLENLKGGAIPVRFLQKTLSADQYKRIENVKRYINRYKQRLNEATTQAEQQKLRAKLLKFENELKNYGEEI